MCGVDVDIQRQRRTAASAAAACGVAARPHARASPSMPQLAGPAARLHTPRPAPRCRSSPNPATPPRGGPPGPRHAAPPASCRRRRARAPRRSPIRARAPSRMWSLPIWRSPSDERLAQRQLERLLRLRGDRDVPAAASPAGQGAGPERLLDRPPDRVEVDADRRERVRVEPLRRAGDRRRAARRAPAAATPAARRAPRRRAAGAPCRRGRGRGPRPPRARARRRRARRG